MNIPQNIENQLFLEYQVLLLSITKNKNLRRNIDRWDVITVAFLTIITLISIFGMSYAASYMICILKGKSVISLGFVVKECKENRETLLKMTTLIRSMDWLTKENLIKSATAVHKKTKEFLMDTFEDIDSFIDHIGGE